jgi:hypothetical protein
MYERIVKAIKTAFIKEGETGIPSADDYEMQIMQGKTFREVLFTVRSSTVLSPREKTSIINTLWQRHNPTWDRPPKKQNR